MRQIENFFSQYNVVDLYLICIYSINFHDFLKFAALTPLREINDSHISWTDKLAVCQIPQIRKAVIKIHYSQIKELLLCIAVVVTSVLN